jgi:hypothetical protein
MFIAIILVMLAMPLVALIGGPGMLLLLLTSSWFPWLVIIGLVSVVAFDMALQRE